MHQFGIAWCNSFVRKGAQLTAIIKFRNDLPYMTSLIQHFKITLTGILSACLLANCQSTQPLKQNDRASISKVYVNSRVKMPEKPAVQTRGDVWAMALGGAIGGAIAGANMSKEDMTQQYLQAHKIQVDQMFRSDFTQHLNKSGLFIVVDSPAKADAQIDLVVQMYGIGQNGNAFSNKYRTVMCAQGTLTKKGGALAWKNFGYSLASDGKRPQSTLDNLFKNPVTMRHHMQLATQVTAYKLVQKLSSPK